MFVQLLTYALGACNLLFGGTKVFFGIPTKEELSMFARLLTYAAQAYNLLFGGTKVSFGIPTKKN